MTRLLLGIFWLLMASAATAQVSVVAGNHPTFTRILLQNLDAEPLAIGWDGALLNVQIGGPSSFNETAFFAPIGRERIAAAIQQSNMISFQVVCDCTIWRTDIQDRAMVIDVVDAGRSAEIILSAVPPLQVTEEVQIAQSMPPEPDLPDQPGLSEEETSALRQELLNALRQAATNGSIDLVDEPPDNLDDSMPSPGNQIRLVRPGLNSECAPFPPLPDTSNPGELFLDAREQHRTSLAAFDAVAMEAVHRQAAIFLALGLLDEMRHMLESFDAQDPLLAWQADVLDAERVAGEPPEQWCPGQADMWLVAAKHDIDDMTVESALTHLSDQPVSFRRLIGTRMAEVLLALDRLDDLVDVLNLLERDGSEASADAVFLRAELLVRNGRTDQARALFVRIAEGRSENAPLAVARLLELSLGDAADIAPSLISGAEEMVLLTGRSDVGRRIQRLLATAYARNGAIDALSAILSASVRDGAISASEQARWNAGLLLQVSPEFEGFADLALRGHVNLGVDPVASEARLHLARGLVQLGLPTPASEIVGPLGLSGAQAGHALPLIADAVMLGAQVTTTGNSAPQGDPSRFAALAETQVPSVELADAPFSLSDNTVDGAGVADPDLLAETQALRAQLQRLLGASRE